MFLFLLYMVQPVGEDVRAPHTQRERPRACPPVLPPMDIRVDAIVADSAFRVSGTVQPAITEVFNQESRQRANLPLYAPTYLWKRRQKRMPFYSRE